MPAFKAGDEVFVIKEEEEDLLNPRRRAEFVDYYDMWDAPMHSPECLVKINGIETSAFEHELSLADPIKTGATNFQLMPSRLSLVPFPIPVQKRMLYDRDLYLDVENEITRWTPRLRLTRRTNDTDAMHLKGAPLDGRRSCDILDEQHKLIREGDIVVILPNGKDSGGFYQRYVVLWDYAQHRTVLEEITGDRYLSGNPGPSIMTQVFRIVGSVVAIPETESRTHEIPNLYPPMAVYNARRRK